MDSQVVEDSAGVEDVNNNNKVATASISDKSNSITNNPHHSKDIEAKQEITSFFFLFVSFFLLP